MEKDIPAPTDIHCALRTSRETDHFSYIDQK